jgi:hypothetical protein
VTRRGPFGCPEAILSPAPRPRTRRSATAALALLVGLGCAEPPPPPAPAPVEAPAPALPALPADAFFQVVDVEPRLVHRLANDGRYLLQLGDGAPRELAPVSRVEPGRPRLSDRARDRIRAQLDAVGFFRLGPELPASSPDLGQDAPPSRLRPLVFMARDPGTGRVHEVRVTGDGASPSTLGPLGPLWEALEDEVLGGWSP